MDLTVVIPSFGFTALLRLCLVQLERSLAALAGGSRAIVVVDNASPFPYQPSYFLTPGAKLLRLDRPHSFSAACNRGARLAPADHYLFLNNDVLLHPLALSEMLALIREPNTGICGARLVYLDDTIQHCGVRFDRGKRGPHHEFHGRHTSSVSRIPRRFQAVTGASLLITAATFDSLGGFDEAFPFGYEDVDLCLRAGQLGRSIVCSQAYDSIHLESMSDKRPHRHSASRKVFFDRWRGRYTFDAGETG